MSQTLIIARREFLSYVTTWGFWLSLLIFPVIAAAVFWIAVFNARAETGLHIAVVTDDPAIMTALEDAVAGADIEALARELTQFLDRRNVDDDRRAMAMQAFGAAPDGERVSAAFGALGDEGTELEARFRPPQPLVVLVEPPARDPDALRPYLLGEEGIISPDGDEVSLHAAMFVTRDANGAVNVDYWSTAVTEFTAKGLLTEALQAFMRTEAFGEAGVNAQQLAAINQLQPAVRDLTPEREGGEAEVSLTDQAPYYIGLALGYMLWVVVFSVANMLLTSTIEERSSKVFDSLLATTNAHQILLGKLLGVAMVSITFLLSWLIFAIVGLTLGLQLVGGSAIDQILSSFVDYRLILPFLAYFVVGYLMLGTLYLAIGSLCDTIQEAQTLMTPMMVVLMIPVFILGMSFGNPTSPLINIAAWVPIYTPFVMLARLPDDPPLYQIVGTTVLMILTAALVFWISTRVFRHGLIAGGGISSLRSVLRGLLPGGGRRAT